MTEDRKPWAEGMLAAVIKAQHLGGCEKVYPDVLEITGDYAHCKKEWVQNGGAGMVSGRFHVLEILLDRDGLKAAYGGVETRIETGDKKKDILMNAVVEHMKDKGHMPAFWENAAHVILMAWIAGGAEDAIRTAYELFPRPTDPTSSLQS